MYRLTVHEKHRREGIGLALTRAGEDYLRSRGVRRITALVAFEDDTAGAFWESAGYPQDQEIGRRVRNLSPTTENAPAGSRGEFWGYYREERYVSLYMWIRGR